MEASARPNVSFAEKVRVDTGLLISVILADGEMKYVIPKKSFSEVNLRKND